MYAGPGRGSGPDDFLRFGARAHATGRPQRPMAGMYAAPSAGEVGGTACEAGFPPTPLTLTLTPKSGEAAEAARGTGEVGGNGKAIDTGVTRATLEVGEAAGGGVKGAIGAIDD